MLTEQDLKVLEIVRQYDTPTGVKRMAFSAGMKYNVFRASVQKLSALGLVERTPAGNRAVTARAVA